MTASAFASILHARKTGRGRWMARCPAHPDRNPSLSITEGKKVPVLIRCRSNGCDTKDVLAALGLKWGDLFDGEMSREAQERLTLEQTRERLERQLGLVIIIGTLEKPKYWAAAERRIRAELEQIRCRLEPEKIFQEYRERNFKRRLARVGWDGLWREIR